MTAPTEIRPGPNAVLPHGTDSRRKTHAAHGQTCVLCWPGTGLPDVRLPKPREAA